jgi:hypothetical protein
MAPAATLNRDKQQTLFSIFCVFPEHARILKRGKSINKKVYRIKIVLLRNYH